MKNVNKKRRRNLYFCSSYKKGEKVRQLYLDFSEKMRLFFARYLVQNLALQVVRNGQIAVGVALMKRVTLKCEEKLLSLKKNENFTLYQLQYCDENGLNFA
jgi:hypothetical protein